MGQLVWQGLPHTCHMTDVGIDRGELQQAVQYFEVALRHGSPFEAFHLLAEIHATTARLPAHAGGRPGMCGVSVAWYKLVAERGSWRTDDFVGEADRAWARGDEEDAALVGWVIGAEMGYEVAQNNVAWVLDRGLGGHLFEGAGDKHDKEKAGNGGAGEGVVGKGVEKGMERERLREKAMRWWVRSAAQDNVDAMVKVGDLYCEWDKCEKWAELKVSVPAHHCHRLTILPACGYDLSSPFHVSLCIPRTRSRSCSRDQILASPSTPRLTEAPPSNSPPHTTKQPQTPNRPPWRIGTLGGCTRWVKACLETGIWPRGIMI